ncbi:MAG: Csu type fimbrial protein [Vulcanimicrobiaceae bacterium]
MIKKPCTVVAACALALVFAGPAFAGSNTATVTINGSVSQSCTAFTPTSGTMTFPAYDAFNNASAVLDAGNSLSFTTKCTKGAQSVNFTVDGGLNYANASSGNRAMKSGSTNDYLSYQLYQDSGHATAWPFNTSNGTGTAVNLGTINSSTTNQVLNLYGEAPAGQDPSVATDYTDTVTVAVNF